ncbi:MAG: M48 family metalloprotease [Candidatus Sulfotelmatobacter sp.]
MTKRYCILVFTVVLLFVCSLFATSKPAKFNPNDVIGRIFENEHALVVTMRTHNPMVESYLQHMEPDETLGFLPFEDRYFLGRVQFGQSDEKFYLDKRLIAPMAGAFSKFYSLSPVGFGAMIFVDRAGFESRNYRLRYMQREFLGEVRCLVFEVTPLSDKKNRFKGEIWAEDVGYNIVRFNGSYGTFHVDSWRMNLRSGQWLPSFVYSEEFDSSKPQSRHPRLKAQTRIWGYNLGPAGREQEFAEVLVDEATVRDRSETPDLNPLEIQRSWERRAEDNVIDKLQELGMLAPEGDVDKILQTVITNLEVTNNITLDPEVRCRVLLTTPIEIATIGRTIMISRGLLDALPNESALAAILSHALAHAVLGHELDASFSFSDRLVVPSYRQLPLFEFKHSPEQEQDADALGLKIISNSPYKDNLAEAGLFLKTLAEYSHRVPNLTKANLGESLVTNSRVSLMVALAERAPKVDLYDTQQIVALPLGSRVKLDPWAGDLNLVKAKPPRIYSPKDKLALEVTPFSPYLVRLKSAKATSAVFDDPSQEW